MTKEENNIILSRDDKIIRVSVRFADEDVWLMQNQLTEIYKTCISNVGECLNLILDDKRGVVVRDFRITTQHGAIEGQTQTRGVLTTLA